MIIIDSKEKEDVQVEKYLHTKGINTRREALTFNGVECGDYTNAGYDFLVERKSWKDYLSSLTDGSLLMQMIKMNENFDGPKYLMFEGDWEAMLHSVKRNGIKQWAETFPLRIQHVYGIGFKICYDPLESANFLMLLDRYASGLTKDVNPWRGTHVKKTLDLRKRPLLTVPMLGEPGVDSLLKEYGNIMDVVEACGWNPNEVARTVKNVGKTSAEKIYDIFYGTEPVVDSKIQKKIKNKKKNDKKRKAYYNKQNRYYMKKRRKY